MNSYISARCNCVVLYEECDIEGVPPWMEIKQCPVCAAAPDLLKACQLGQDAMSALFNALVDYGREGKPFGVDELYRQCLEANEVMLAAIACAEGGE